LVGLALVVLAVILTPRPALAVPVKSKVIDGATGEALKVVRRGVFSISNANDRYVAVAELEQMPTVGPALVLGRQRLIARSWGSGFGQGAGACNWEVDRAAADKIAAAWKIKRRDRVQLDAGLVARWRAKQPTYAVGKPLPLVVEVANQGTATVGLQLGGRMVGRDEHFAFTATRDGAPVPTIPLGPSVGGGMFQFKALAPGDKVEIEVDAAGWIAPTAAGTYTLECTYRSELVSGTHSATWPDRGAETWDLTLAGRLDLVVK
jgi:hypothetical protein